MQSLSRRVAFGFIAAVISVLTFHQGTWAAFHFLQLPGLGMPPPFPTDAIPPWGVPRIVSLCFWGGVWGAVFGAVWRGSRASTWWAGIILGICASLTGMFIVAALKGLPIGGNWIVGNWVKSLTINGVWGLGVGLLLMALPVRSAVPDDHAYR